MGELRRLPGGGAAELQVRDDRGGAGEEGAFQAGPQHGTCKAGYQKAGRRVVGAERGPAGLTRRQEGEWVRRQWDGIGREEPL